ERPRARRDELLRERPDVEPRRPRQLLTGVGVRATFDGDVGGPPVPDDGGPSSRRIHPDAHVFAATGAASRSGSSARSGSWSIGRSTSSTTNAMTNAFSVSTWNMPTGTPARPHSGTSARNSSIVAPHAIHRRRARPSPSTTPETGTIQTAWCTHEIG